ncbi:MAG: hypothetical protein AAGF89_14630, partial [Bacteroidota bacterium]
VAVTAAIIFYIGREVLGAFRHPSNEELQDYWSGKLRSSDPKAFRRISEHLASCEMCRDRLDEIRKYHAGPGADAPLIERKY